METTLKTRKLKNINWDDVKEEIPIDFYKENPALMLKASLTLVF